ncbi:MAG TPA: DNA-directed DNA polymerase II small subunit [Candidatus Norongarragalinales archaeon]|nr:DNA-directed DNA polymerase II small subunit [Candidatus Norongarragalinales archaeon]
MPFEKALLLQMLKEKELMASPEALTELAEADDPQKVVDELAKRSLVVVDHEQVHDIIESLGVGKKVIQVEVAQQTAYNPPAKGVEARLSLSIRNDVTNNSRCTGNVEDFVRYFNDRFDKHRKSLRGMATNGSGIYSIRDVKNHLKGKEARIIAMVYEKRVTKNGHLMIDIEDDDSTASVLVPKESKIFYEAMQILNDEVIAFDVFHSDSSLLIAKNFLRPGRLLQERTKKLADEEVFVGFVSDLHVGSKFFLQENFQKFLEFLNGKGTPEQREVAGKIKYLSFAGDNVDGIGVYPGQEKQLITKGIHTQYEIFCEFVKNIPEHIEIIIAPGNHDAVRTAEPQPALPQEFWESLKGFSNIHFVGNPSAHLLHGIELLMYHGTSLDGIISHTQMYKDGYEHPEKVAVGLLQRKHLSPLYGEDPLVPEPKDYMVIEETPDMFHFGHVHKNGHIENYNGTMIVNSGTWQDRTDYQVRLGHMPTPCIFPYYNLKTGKLNHLNFREG